MDGWAMWPGQALEELVRCRQVCARSIPHDHERRRARHYSGSGHAQAAGGPVETSTAVAARHTLLRNEGWNLSWEHRLVLPCVAVTA